MAMGGRLLCSDCSQRPRTLSTIRNGIPSSSLISFGGIHLSSLHRIESSLLYSNPSSSSAICPGQSSGLEGFEKILRGSPKYLAISLTALLYRSAIGWISHAPSPYFVKYPSIISLLSPVPTTSPLIVFGVIVQFCEQSRVGLRRKMDWVPPSGAWSCGE